MLSEDGKGVQFVKYFERERPHSCNFYYCVWSLLFSSVFVTGVNLLLGLIYKLNFIVGENIVYIEFGSVRGFNHPLWVLEQMQRG